MRKSENKVLAIEKKLERMIIIGIVVTAAVGLVLVGVAWAATDWGCVGRCTWAGYAYPLCVKWCSY